MKITVVGAGAVGATCADNIARKELCDELVILDIKEGVAEGKAMDLMQTATLLGFDTRITGSTNDYAKTAGTNVAVITSGIPRKPGMTREELIGINAGIVKSVTENLLKHSPDAIIVVISNPMDTMTYLALKSSECFKIFSVTDFTIPALMPINSSLVIPGLRGMPEVITATLVPAVLA